MGDVLAVDAASEVSLVPDEVGIDAVALVGRSELWSTGKRYLLAFHQAPVLSGAPHEQVVALAHIVIGGRQA